MSTGTKTPLAQARDNARRFAALFDGCHERWVVAGSIRRERPEVGDIEHVVIPLMYEAKPEAALFGDALPAAEPINALWSRLDLLVEQGTLAKARYGETQTTRWGDLYRGVVFDGVKHEIFTADARNWGAILAIRTGPAPFSEMLVTRLKQRGMYRQERGYVRYARGKAEGDVRAVGGEEEYLELCGVPWLPPHERDGYMETRA